MKCVEGCGRVGRRRSHGRCNRCASARNVRPDVVALYRQLDLAAITSALLDRRREQRGTYYPLHES